MDQDVIASALAGNDGFVKVLGPEVLRAVPGDVRLRLDAGPELHQHFGGPHAAVIFGLGETAAFCLLLAEFGDLVEAGAAPLVKDARIGYTAIATGPLLATARLVDDAAAARAVFAERGSMRFDVEVVFTREDDGSETSRATYRMGVKRF